MVAIIVDFVSLIKNDKKITTRSPANVIGYPGIAKENASVRIKAIIA